MRLARPWIPFVLALALAGAERPIPLTLPQFSSLLEPGKGQVVLLFLYESDCPACRRTYPIIQGLLQDYPPDRVRPLLVSIDYTEEALAGFLGPGRLDFKPYWIPDYQPGAMIALLEKRGSGFRDQVPFAAVFDDQGHLIKEWVCGNDPQDYRRVIGGCFGQNPR